MFFPSFNIKYLSFRRTKITHLFLPFFEITGFKKELILCGLICGRIGLTTSILCSELTTVRPRGAFICLQLHVTSHISELVFMNLPDVLKCVKHKLRSFAGPEKMPGYLMVAFLAVFSLSLSIATHIKFP